LLSHAYTISLLLSFIIIFFFTDPATTEIYTLSLHDALPISIREWQAAYKLAVTDVPGGVPQLTEALGVAYLHKSEMANDVYRNRSEEHTSELQSRGHLVCRLLLEKKKKKKKKLTDITYNTV